MRSLVTLSIVLIAGEISAAEPVDYLRDVKPLLSSRCYACHGALRQKSGLRLDTAGLIRKGSKSGPIIVVGKSAGSALIAAVTGATGSRMPPEKEGAALTSAQVALLKAWIDQGAKAPDEPIPEDPRLHWAFRTPLRPEVPKSDGAANPIDAFLRAEYHKQGLQPRPRADKEVLLRRIYLDLIGLPPTRAELHVFLADTSADAYEKVVDRLLASPHHGERWGRHWMDVWRYSDWYGRRAVPDWWNSASQIWRWRDWIVRSLNADKGYDEMVRQMLAADELAPEDDANLVATGYLTRNWYALNYNQWLRDTVEHTGKSFLGLTFNCAHCHDHKYDPISQEEYFRFRAFFEPIEMRQDRVPGEPDPGPFQKYKLSVLRQPVKVGSIRIMDERLDAKTYMYLGGDERVRAPGKEPVSAGAPAFLAGDRLAISPVELPATAYYPGLKSFIQHEDSARGAKALAEAREALPKVKQALVPARTRLAEVEAMLDPRRPNPPALLDAREQARQALYLAESAIPLAEARLATAEAELHSLQARIAADNAIYKKTAGNVGELSQAASKADRQANHLTAREKLLQAEQSLAMARLRADHAATGKPKDQAQAALKKAEQQRDAARKAVDAAEQALAATSTKYTPISPVYPAKSTGRRKALAEWLASKDNPLTARVAINHIWMRHFGKPLVESVFDFGRNGKRPSHPELLDWLAVEFMGSGARDQGADKTTHHSPLTTHQPWSMKKLHRLIVTSDAYQMDSRARADDPNLTRDPDNRYLWQYPRRRMEAEAVRDSILVAADELDRQLGGPEIDNKLELTSRRRSLYFTIYPEDGGHLKFVELFDAPDPCDCYRRMESTLPQQALALTNSELALGQSRLLAGKLWNALAEKSETAFVRAAFEQVLTRGPTDVEKLACLDFLRKQAELYRDAAPQTPSRGALGPSADPALRARESLVRALFNHNDFVMIR